MAEKIPILYIMTKIEMAAEFGKISGNLNYAVRRCKDDITKETLEETLIYIQQLYKKLI